jgi:hypothetical protein
MFCLEHSIVENMGDYVGVPLHHKSNSGAPRPHPLQLSTPGTDGARVYMRPHFPVASAFVVLGCVMCIFAVAACELFSDRDLLNFGSFKRSLFTMFQVSLATAPSHLAEFRDFNFFYECLDSHRPQDYAPLLGGVLSAKRSW